MNHHKGGHIKYFSVKHPSAAGTKTGKGACFCHQHFRKMQRKQPTHFKDKTNVQGNTRNNKSLSGSFITVSEGFGDEVFVALASVWQIFSPHLEGLFADRQQLTQLFVFKLQNQHFC